MSYTNLLYHIIFRTKYGSPTICEQNEKELYRYIWGFVNKHQSKLYQINGMPDHIHLLVSLHPTYSIASFVQQLKNATHLYIERNPHLFPDFYAWSVGYCALSYNYRDKEKIQNYIKNQKVHHQNIHFSDEVKALLSEAEIDFDPIYFNRNL